MMPYIIMASVLVVMGLAATIVLHWDKQDHGKQDR